jgi:hypothetical protein
MHFIAVYSFKVDDYVMSEHHHSAEEINSEICEANLRQMLANLPKKSRRKSHQNTSFEFVVRNLAALLEARAKGYSYEDLTELIQAETQREISSGTLRKYIERARKQARSLPTHTAQPKGHPPGLDQPKPKPRLEPFGGRSDRHSPRLASPENSSSQGPRPTLFDPDNQAHASEDEFENLS